MNPLLGIALVIGGLFLFNTIEQAAHAKDLQFSIAQVQLNNIGLQSTLVITLDIQNPTPSAYTIKSFAGDLYINDVLSGNVSSFVPVTIGADSETNYPLTARLSTGVVISDLINLFNGDKKVTVRLAGNADAGLVIPFDIQYSLI